MALQFQTQHRVRVSSASPAPRRWEDVTKMQTAGSGMRPTATATTVATKAASGSSSRTASVSTMTPSNSTSSVSSGSVRPLTPSKAVAGPGIRQQPQVAGAYRPSSHLGSRHPQQLQAQLHQPRPRNCQQLQLPQHMHHQQQQQRHLQLPQQHAQVNREVATPSPKTTGGSSFSTATPAEAGSFETSAPSSPASSVHTEHQEDDMNSEEGSTGTAATSSSFPSIHNMAAEVSAAFWRSLSFWESKSQQQEQQKLQEKQQQQKLQKKQQKEQKQQQQCEEGAASCQQGLKRQPLLQHFRSVQQPRQGLRQAERMRVGVIAPGAGTTANAAVYARLGSQPGVEMSIKGKPRANYDRYPSSWPGGSNGPNLESFAAELSQGGRIERHDVLVFGSRGGQVVLPSLWHKYGARVPPAVVINGGCAMGLPTVVEWPETAITFLLMGAQDSFRGRMGREEYLADAQARVPKGNSSTAILFVNEMTHMPQSVLLGDVLEPMLRTIASWKSGSVPTEHLKAVVDAVSAKGKWSGRLLYTSSPGCWEERSFGSPSAALGGA